MQHRWEIFATTLHRHHTGEDEALWPLLLERADDEEVATLEAMEAEHSEIDPVLSACHAGFARMVEKPDEDVRAALSVRLTAARESLGRHLAHEERDAIAIIQRHLTDEEWRTLEEEHFAKDVTFGEKLRLLPWLCHGVPEDVLRDVFGRVGGPFPVLWRLTRGRFERKHRAAFGH
jgi:iron-sulfur cluster repair protein YtfE (RIC family)